MKYIIALILMVSMVGQTWAEQVDTSGLTPEQIARLTIQAEQMKGPTTTKAADVAEWANIGKELGSGLAATAKELGVTANELAQTPVGIFAMVLIAWNYMGESIVGIVFGFIWMLVAIPTWAMLYYKKFVVLSVETYDKGARDDGKRKIVVYRKGDGYSSDEHFFFFIALASIVIVGGLSIFA